MCRIPDDCAEYKRRRNVWFDPRSVTKAHKFDRPQSLQSRCQPPKLEPQQRVANCHS